MKQVKAILEPSAMGDVLQALSLTDGLGGITMSEVFGWGASGGAGVDSTVTVAGHGFAPRMKIEVIVPDAMAAQVVEAISDSGRGRAAGGGTIFVSEVLDIVRIHQETTR